MKNFLKRSGRALINAFDSHHRRDASKAGSDNKWLVPVPFVLLNLSVLFVFVVGVSWIAVAVAVALYVVRMFGITAAYHRYFSHRTYKASRPVQFALAFLGNTAAQRGPLWWAAHHRHHHATSDTPEDTHSPIQEGGFWNSHMLWWGRRKNVPTRMHLVKDLSKYPELVFLDRFDAIAPFTLALFTFGLGALLQVVAPGLGTNGWQMLVWGFVISTVVLFHGVATINSLAHVFGSRRFRTTDDSRNNFWLALVTLGEGWHNNHHHYPNSARQGFYWWEIDLSYYGLKALEKLGLVRDLKPVPARILADGRSRNPARPVPVPAAARVVVSTASVARVVRREDIPAFTKAASADVSRPLETAA
jgi:stearoyl-CoA desaturase (Delta-9 desaturase)